MGCHTWCYAHIPSEADKWAQEYKRIFKREAAKVETYNVSDEEKAFAKELSKIIENMPVKDIPKYLNEKKYDYKYYSLLFELIGIDYDYGLFNVYKGKIYREVTDYRGEDPDVMKNWPFQKSYHDIFRIYDYDAEPCFSLEETLKRCEEHNLDWNLRTEYDYLINNKEELYEFWEKYPDGVIEFD